MSDSDPGLMTIFAEALERTDPADRAAYLDATCGDDAPLRQRVEGLLAAHDGAGRFLEPDATAMLEPGSPASLRTIRDTASGATLLAGSATEIQGPDGSIPSLANSTPPGRTGGFVPGQVICGRYTLLEVLGEGGMGTVYRAEQSQPVKRQVALKLIKVGMDSRTVLARFDAERQALAMMDHPNIARVYDGGATDANQPFFVMEFVRGVAITDYCDQHRLSVDARLQLFVAVCQAVQHAHQKGIIHRDIKPSNVMVTEVDGRPTPKVIDFGVAKATEFSLTDQTLGDTGAIVGTPTYMSPEQADPSTQDIDTRTDIYALGVILYELLAGSTPLDATQFQRGALLEMLRMVREVDPSKPSTKVSTSDALPSIAANRGIEPEHLKRELRGDLDWIVMKSLEKDRTRRYETANGLGADILRHLASEPVLAAPPSRSYRLRKFARKHRAGVIAASLVVLALVAGVAGATWGLFEARRSADAERLAKLEAREERTLAEEKEKKAQAAAEEEKKAKDTVEAVLKFVEDKVFAAARPKGQDGGLGYDVTLAAAITAALPAIEKGFSDKPLTDARLRRTIGLSFYYLGKPGLAAEQFQASLSLSSRHLGPDHPDTLASMNNLANCSPDALKLREEVLTRRMATLGPDHPDTFMSMSNLANSYDDVGRNADALKLREETLARQKARIGPDHIDTLRTMSNLAVSYSIAGRNAESLKLHEETLARQKARLGPDHPDTLRTMYCLAINYSIAGRNAESLKLFEETLALRKARLGPDHIETLASMNSLANCYLQAGRVRESLPLLAICSTADPKDTVRSMKLAALQAWLGLHEDYAATRRRILANAGATGDAIAAERAAKVCSIFPSANSKELDAAILLARRAVDLGKDHEYKHYFLMALGMAEFRFGRFAEAEVTLTAAMGSANGNRHVGGTSAFYRAMSLFRQGKNDEASKLATEAAAKMKPLPTHEQDPLAGDADHDDLILWLAYKEAKALIGFDPPTAPKAPGAK